MRSALAAGLLLISTLSQGAEAIPGIGPVGEVEEVQGGYQFTEGPASDGQGNLYFTDIPQTEIHHLDPNGKIGVFTDESRHANGLMSNTAGELVACEMDGQVVAWNVKTKARRVIADKYDGKRFNAPNDLVIDNRGGIYFTDPHYHAPRPLPQEKMSVYYVAPNGKVARVVEHLNAPNGILLSLDEQTLYVLPSEDDEMQAYPVQSPGKLGEGKVFCKVTQAEGRDNGGSDGAALDVQGNLYLTTARGVEVVSPEGMSLGIIELPQQPANVEFGGPANKTLYATARTALYAVPMEVAGHRYGE